MKRGRIGLPLAAALATCIASAPAPALAGAFAVVPVRLDMGTQSPTGVLKVTNHGDVPVPIQVTAVTWSQDSNGEAVYADTLDLVVFPKLLTIPPGQEHVVRVGYRGPGAGEVERTYRLFLEELPIPETPASGLTMNLRLGVPVFVAPEQLRAGPSLSGLGVAQGVLGVTVENGGNSHFVVGRIAAEGTDAAGERRFVVEDRGWYVLAGGRRTFILDLPEAGCRASRAIRVSVEVEGGDLSGRLDVDPARCAPAP